MPYEFQISFHCADFELRVFQGLLYVFMIIENFSNNHAKGEAVVPAFTYYHFNSRRGSLVLLHLADVNPRR